MYTHQNQTLFVDGVSTLDLAATYGTPLYVYSENKILKNLQEIRSAFLDKYPNTHAAYACKAFCSQYICRLLNEQGFWLDVVSGGELYTALAAGFPADRIEFNGNNKSPEELRFALDHGIGRIVVDNPSELYLIEQIAQKPVKVLFRLTPNVSTDTHDYISTGKKDSKFGIPLDDSILFPLIQDALKSDRVDFLGFHFHVGSQLMTPTAHLAALEVVLPIMKEIKERFAVEVRELNIGGGFGIRYTEVDNPLSVAEFVDPVMARLEMYCEQEELLMPHVSIEPGRFVVGEAGMQLYTIGNIKVIPEIKTYVSIDGGMTDNLRPGLYGAKYDGVIANKAQMPQTETVDISGKCCESTDIIIKNFKCAKAETGDLLAVYATGAYGYAMASTYNRLPIPAVVVVRDDAHQLIIRRQTYADLLRDEV